MGVLLQNGAGQSWQQEGNRLYRALKQKAAQSAMRRPQGVLRLGEMPATCDDLFCVADADEVFVNLSSHPECFFGNSRGGQKDRAPASFAKRGLQSFFDDLTPYLPAQPVLNVVHLNFTS